jgi:hypothetical protein
MCNAVDEVWCPTYLHFRSYLRITRGTRMCANARSVMRQPGLLEPLHPTPLMFSAAQAAHLIPDQRHSLCKPAGGYGLLHVLRLPTNGCHHDCPAVATKAVTQHKRHQAVTVWHMHPAGGTARKSRLSGGQGRKPSACVVNVPFCKPCCEVGEQRVVTLVLYGCACVHASIASVLVLLLTSLAYACLAS